MYKKITFENGKVAIVIEPFDFGSSKVKGDYHMYNGSLDSDKGISLASDSKEKITIGTYLCGNISIEFEDEKNKNVILYGIKKIESISKQEILEEYTLDLI